MGVKMGFLRALLEPLFNERGEIGLGAEIGGSAPNPEPAGNLDTEPAGNQEEGGDIDGGAQPEPVRYTAEELAALPFEKLTELNPGLKKNVDKFFSQKGEETKTQLEQRMRQLEAQVSQGQQRPSTQEDVYYQQFKNDPVGFVRQLTAGARAKVAEGEYSAAADAQLIAAEFQARLLSETTADSQNRNRSAVVQQVYQNVAAELNRSIPNFETVAPQINEYAINEFSDLGLDMDTIGVMTNPEIWAAVAQITGNPRHANISPLITKAVYKMMTKANAGKNLKAKQNITPPRTVGADVGRPAQGNASLAALLKKAQETKNPTDQLAYATAKEAASRRR